MIESSVENEESLRNNSLGLGDYDMLWNDNVKYVIVLASIGLFTSV